MNENWGDGWLVILLFAMIFGGQGLFGGGQNSASTQEILFGQQFQGINQAIGKVGDGICSSTYALNNSILGEGRAIQSEICAMNAGLSASIHSEGEQTRALINANEMQRLRDELTTAKASISNMEQNAYLLGQMGKWVANPAST